MYRLFFRTWTFANRHMQFASQAIAGYDTAPLPSLCKAGCGLDFHFKGSLNCAQSKRGRDVMRNFNSSFVKNAVSRFGNEASQVLRTFSNPATGLLRLMQSVVRAIWSVWLPTSYRQLKPIRLTGMTADKGNCSPRDRFRSVEMRQTFGRGIARANVHVDRNVS